MKKSYSLFLFRTISPFIVFSAFLLSSTCFYSLNAQGIIYVNKLATGNNDGSTWTHAFTGLQSALDVATSGDSIWVAAGIYKPTKDKTGNSSPADPRTKTFQMVGGVSLFGGFAGIETNIEDRDVHSNETVLNGDIGTIDDYSDNCYNVVKGVNNYLLDGFTISDGNANGATANETDMGGGILNQSVSNIKVNSCVIKNNRGKQAGGISNFSCTGSVLITNCVFLADTSNAGGGIGNWNTPANISQCRFLYNSADQQIGGNGYGGAIYNWGAGSTSNVVNCTFYKNFGNAGAAIHNRGVSSSCKNSILWQNNGDEIVNTNDGNCGVSYCDIDQSTYSSGTGCFNADPMIYIWGTKDYWVHPSSPCINKGDPASPLDPDGSRADIGIWVDIYSHDIDLTIEEMVTPSEQFATGTCNVSVTLVNRGTSTITSATINWELNGVLKTPKSWSGNLEFGAISDTILLGNFNFDQGYHTIKVWTSNPVPGPDKYPENDTLITIVRAINDLDIGITSVVEPLNPFKFGLRDVRVSIKNFSAYSIITSAKIDFKIDNITQTTFNWTGSLSPGEIDTVKIKANHNFTESLHTIKVWTSNPNAKTDENNTNDTLEVSVKGCSPLQGDTLTIKASGGDFTTFSGAVNYLTSSDGIEGPIVFLVESNTYNEHILIPYIPGTSRDFTITFQSASGDSNDVILTYSAGDYTVRLQQAKYVIFKNMTISSGNGHVITLHNSATYNQFLNNRIIGVEGTSSLVVVTMDYIFPVPPDQPRGYFGNNVFSNNYMLHGSQGINISSSLKSAGLEITDNILQDQLDNAIVLGEVDGAVISGNTIASNSTITGIYLNYCKDNFTIERNKILLPGGGTGIYWYRGSNNTSKPDRVTNNYIHVNTSADNQYGIWLFIENRNLIFDHNSVNITGNNNGSAAVLFGIPENLFTDLRNNIFSNKAGGIAIYHYYFNNITSDYNCLFTTGPNITDRSATLEDHQNLTKQDLHSFSLDPRFLSNDDLHTFNPYLNNKGVPITDISIDIDGDARDASHPDIGADEYDPLPALSGNYDIGPSAPLFKNFNEAVDSLILVGVGGPVTFNVENGTYNEQVTIPWIANADETNTITFQSASEDSTKVTLTHAASSENDNYTLKLDGADYFTFKQITLAATGAEYARIVSIGYKACHNSFLNNQFLGVNNKSELVYAYRSYDTSNIFINNLFSGGISGIHLEQGMGSGTSSEISGNEFYNQTAYAIYLKDYIYPVIESNTIYSRYKITGIYLESARNQFTVGNNLVHLNAGGRGIEIFNINSWVTTDDTSLIYNNHICLKTDPEYGIYLFYNSLNTKIVYNSVHLRGNNSSSICFTASESGYMYLKNNILANNAYGKALYAYSGLTSDYNDLYSNGANLAGYSDLKYWQTYSNQDLNSFSVDPYFENDSSYHVLNPYLKGAGTPVAAVLKDIDGELRNAVHPDIGADEFTVCSSPISGTFTIGGVTPDYPTLYEAVKKLVCCGVNGPVTFNIDTDTLVEQISIQEIPGASATNTITFQSLTGDSTDVLITYTSLNQTYKHTIQLNGADYITFKKLSFSSGETWGWPIELKNQATHNRFLNNRFIFPESTEYGDGYAFIYSNGSLDSANVFISNFFNGGSIGISMEGIDNTRLVSGTVIRNNIFSDILYKGIFLKYHNAPEITGNQVSVLSTATYSYGIELRNIACEIENNGLIANNFVLLNSTGEVYGLYLRDSKNLSVYYNSVNITGNSKGYALYLFGARGLDVMNNIFSNKTNGNALWFNDTTGNVSDYNMWYFSGTPVFYTPSYVPHGFSDIVAWQNFSGQDMHSLFREPKFLSDTNLHTSDPWLNNIGTPLAEVTTDIDGEPRDPEFPDIGADEFMGAILFEGDYTIGPSGDYASFTEALNAITPVGVKGPVTFTVQNGTYNEQIIIKEIPGVSKATTVTFRTAWGNANVKVNYKATISKNYTIKLDGAKYVILKDMTIEALDADYANIIEFTNGATGNTLTGNLIRGMGQQGMVIYSSSSQDDDNMIENNQIIGGNVGIYMLGTDASQHESGLKVTGNQFEDQYTAAIYLKYQSAPVVSNNMIQHFGLVNYEWVGIFLISCSEQYDTYGLVANNAIALHAETKSAGIVLDATSYQKIYYNTVNIYGNATESRSFNQQNGGEGIVIMNNIFSNRAEGLVIYTTDINAFYSDYNDYYANGSKFIYYNEYIPDLQTWQNNYSKDLTSVSADPMFNADTLLEALQPLLNGGGTPLAEVGVDIRGRLRDPVKPDIGAYEFNMPYARSLKDASKFDIVLYPNPAQGILNIRITGVSSTSRLYLINGMGSIVYTEELLPSGNRYETQVDLSGLPGGLYFVVVPFDNQRVVKKVVVE